MISGAAHNIEPRLYIYAVSPVAGRGMAGIGLRYPQKPDEIEDKNWFRVTAAVDDHRTVNPGNQELVS